VPLAFTSLLADISSEMFYPVLPLFLTDVLHAPTTVVGLVEGLGQACQYGIQGFLAGWQTGWGARSGWPPPATPSVRPASR
jgi:hypothetical protein